MKLYWQPEENVGDKLTPYIYEKLTGNEPVFSRKPGKTLIIGSILHHAKEGDVVFGSGLISPKHLPQSKDITVKGVRGFLTQYTLQKHGIKVGGVVSDPAIVMPEIYKPMVEKEYELGIVPHYVDLELVEPKEGVNIISPRLGVEEFITEMNKCKRIESSSLHGLILAEAYGIPAKRVIYSGKLVGGDFKFDDYQTSKKLNITSADMLNNLKDLLCD